MSNIPEARRILQAALADMSEDPYRAIEQALRLMVRKSPEFVASRRVPPLSDDEREEVRVLRSRGWSLNDIAAHYETNIGRVSEAINEAA